MLLVDAMPAAAGSSILDFLEGTPWWVKVPVGLVVTTSPWWGPVLGERLRGRRPKTPTRRRPSELEELTEDPDVPDPEDEELRKLRDSLIRAVQDMQSQQVRMDRLVRSLDAKDAELRHERAQAAEMSRALAAKEQELVRLREQVDVLIRRREQTPPRGQATPPTDSMPRPER